MAPSPSETGRYRRLRLLGEGGAGRVWLVEDRFQPGRRLALKELADSSRGKEEALRREFATLANLRHPNLVEVLDYGDSWRKEQGLPGYDLLALRLTNRQHTIEKPRFFLMAAIHGRELTTPEAAIYLSLIHI